MEKFAAAMRSDTKPQLTGAVKSSEAFFRGIAGITEPEIKRLTEAFPSLLDIAVGQEQEFEEALHPGAAAGGNLSRATRKIMAVRGQYTLA